ncbi:hypothetical protein [Actinoplanes sp. NPDC049802]|uniref:hypothetical protein n=1 Tax=Actinoplanes sp. NPDC049802 TaxID=3154742 RepID=UPI0033D36F8A
MFSDDVDADLRRLAGDSGFEHRDAARHALAFREGGDVADLVAVYDDPHACGMTEILYAMACSRRPWLNWVPMPSEAISNIATDVGQRIAKGERLELSGLGLSAAEAPSAIHAFQRICGPAEIQIAEFPEPDIRTPLRPGRYAVWRYDGELPVPNVPAPSRAAVELLHEVGGEPWPSPVSGCLKAEPLGACPIEDLLGLLVHQPAPPDTPRWEFLSRDNPPYWFRFLQPWVCLGILQHARHEPWATSTRRAVLLDLAFGAEDWVTDAALFALVTAAYREPELRDEVRGAVRARLEAAARAPRVVTIEESLANLMLVTPGRTDDDRRLATLVLSRHSEPEPEPEPSGKRRWWSWRR